MSSCYPFRALAEVVSDGMISDGDWIESKDQDPDGSVRLIQLADIGDGRYLNKSRRFLTKETASRLKCTPLRRGDILVARMPDPIGRACIYPGDAKEAITVVDICILRVDEKTADARWLMSAINVDFTRRAIERAAGGTTRTRISRGSLQKLLLPTPPLPEQQNISAVLEAVDDKLDVIARQIEATQTLQLGLVQTLLSRGVGNQDAQGEWVPHTDFKCISSQSVPVRWNPRRLGDIAPLIRRPVEINLDATYPELGLRSYGKGTFHKPALLGTEVGNKRLFQIKAGDLLFSNVFAWEGAVAVAKPNDDGRYGSHRYMTCVVDEALADTSYVFRYLTTPAGIASLTLASPGGAGRNKTLGLGALADITMPLPPLAEQRKISQILDGVDAKLKVLESKQVACSAMKRGLMQKLLTGEWRVKVDVETFPACAA